MKYGMVIDLTKCTGCQACVVACRAEHGNPPGALINRVEQMYIGRYPKAKPVYVPMACRHCEDPDCVKVCPTEASSRQDDGWVKVDQEKCIGCSACVPACPFGARNLVKRVQPYFAGQLETPYEEEVTREHQAAKIEKCDFCSKRLSQNQLPACVDTCPAQARFFGDLDDPDSPPSKQLQKYGALPVSQDSDTRPCLFYIRSFSKRCGSKPDQQNNHEPR